MVVELIASTLCCVVSARTSRALFCGSQILRSELSWWPALLIASELTTAQRGCNESNHVIMGLQSINDTVAIRCTSMHSRCAALYQKWVRHLSSQPVVGLSLVCRDNTAQHGCNGSNHFVMDPEGIDDVDPIRRTSLYPYCATMYRNEWVASGQYLVWLARSLCISKQHDTIQHNVDAMECNVSVKQHKGNESILIGH